MRIGIAILLAVFCLIVSVVSMKTVISEDYGQPAFSAAEGDALGNNPQSALKRAPGWVTGTEPGIAGFLGETEKGPTEPLLIHDFTEYEEKFGGFTGRSFLPYAVRGFFANGGQKLYIARVISDTAFIAGLKLKNAKKYALTLGAVNGGEWGNRIAVKVIPGKKSTETAPTFGLEVYWFAYSTAKSVKSGKPDPAKADAAETYDDISVSSDSPYSFENIVNNHSALIRISLDEDGTGVMPGVSGTLQWFTGGSDGETPSLQACLGNDGTGGAVPSGLKGLGGIDCISTLYSPLSYRTDGLDKALIGQCEVLCDRTVIFDTAFGDTGPDPWSSHESSFAACYTPWVKVKGFDQKEVVVPPGGFVSGIYARNDLVKGPDIAPVNEPLKGISGVERELSVQEQEALALRKINPVITRTGVDYYAFGAHTLANMLDQYEGIDQRRYVNYLFDTFSARFDWLSGNQLNQALKQEIKLSIENFLDREWARGALIGANQIEAYYVKVDEQEVFLEGLKKRTIVIEIGVALAKPSEYFVLRITK